MAKLEEKLRKGVTEERESDDDEGTGVASLGAATGILPFHLDPLAILRSYCRNKMSFTNITTAQYAKTFPESVPVAL